GTVVEVRDLFFNTPARKKFMRTDSTESLHIIEHVTMDALAHHEIGFTLIMDHREIMRLSPSGSEEERIIQIYGHEFFDGLLKVSSEKDGLAITSYVSKEENFRNKKSHQFIFVNKRPVKDPLITHAVYQAYEGLPKDKHPLFFLYLTVNPKEVDVNVHPSKREVRFSERDRIYVFVRDNVRGSLIRGKREFVRAFMGEDRSERTSISTEISDRDFYISEEREFGYRPSIPFIYLGETFIALSGKDGLVLLD
ncbi:MAG: DNA mismatch repair endonuclease MutL, partial [Thermodesulfovibrionales bacterium]